MEGFKICQKTRGMLSAHQAPKTHRSLGDADSLALSATDTTHEVISNMRVDSMIQTKDGHHGIAAYCI